MHILLSSRLRAPLIAGLCLGLWMVAGDRTRPVAAQAPPQTLGWQIDTLSRPTVLADQDRLRVRVAFPTLDAAARDRAVVALPLANGRIAEARLDTREEFETGYVTSGPLTDGSGTASLSVVGDTLAARLIVDGNVWIVRRDSAGHLLTRVDDSSFAPDGEPLTAPDEGGAAGGGAGDPPTAGDAQTVDLLVVYTPAALSRMGSTSALTAEVNLSVANSNSALANAGLAHRFRLVHLESVSYTESGSSSTDLSRIRNTADGFMDSVHALRDSAGADVVTLLTQASDVCGVGYVMTSNSASFAPNAFNVVISTCAGANLSFAHEVGHNMGLQHNVEDAGFQGVTSYSYGYRVAGVGRTVMAYACPTSGPSCPRATVFSTPSATFSNGTPAGVANSADNARALDLVFATVASFRTAASSCTYAASPTAVTISAAAETVRVAVTTDATCPWGVDVGSTGIVPTQSVLQGGGYVDLAVPANTGVARVLTVVVAGQNVSISQPAACTISLNGSPSSMSWAGGAGSVAVTLASSCATGWTVTSNQSWLTFGSATSGSANGSVAFSVATNTGATPTSRTATITATTGSLTSTFTVTQDPPRLTLTPDPIVFAALRDGVQPISISTPEQEVSLTWTGPTAPVWSASIVASPFCPACPPTSWARLTGTSGTGAATLRVAVNDASNVLAGQSLAYATVRLTAAGYATTDVTVRISIGSTTASAAPFGYLDSPAQGATGLSGSIAIGGWALDDVAVERVDIHRLAVGIDPPAAVQPGGLVYVGRALFVAGARPDVLAAYGASTSATIYPQAQRAGWGLLVLTNALPHQGNGTQTGGQGTFTFVAIAVDIEGRSVELGRRTVTINNDAATVPFGAIDTPGQGGTVPDTAAPYNNMSSYPVFGWALSPGGICIATDGSTIDVLVDGVVVGRPTYNLSRADIANGYPGYCNSNGAVGVYYLNASGLSDGLHTIAWRVRDANGRTAEIGSRYFRVSRGTIGGSEP